MTLPQDFEADTRRLMGDALYATLHQELAAEPPVSIRLNPFKTSATGPSARADALRPGADAVPWCAEGRYLAGRPNFTFDPFLHAGCDYVQEAASMFVAHVLRQLAPTPVLMLDLCAAPGGKSTAARAVLPPGSLLFANEPVRLRASVLAENVQKFGHPDTVVTHNFPRDYGRSGLLFDVILADVPCSGEGMFRKDEGAIEAWSRQHVAQCRQLQRTIVEDVWPALRPGGLLVYSTCTFNAEENEENVDWIARQLGADVVDIPTRPEWNITGALVGREPVCRFIPGKTRGEGLFMAALRKHGESEGALAQLAGPARKPAARKQPDRRNKANAPAALPPVEAWLEGDFRPTDLRGTRLAVPAAWHTLYERAARQLHVLHAGVTLGVQKGRDLVPHASLALSTALRSDAFPRAEVDYATAVAYLRKEAVTLPPDTPRGLVVIACRGHALGFAKNLGGRANNLYPQEWKIKSSHLPDTPVDVLAALAAPTCRPHAD